MEAGNAATAGSAGGAATVGRTYTKGRRQPYLIRKWPGSNWALPLGPYTITQLLVFVGTVYLLLSYREVWAKFGPFNLVIGVGLPLVLTYVTRHTRIEGRDPLRAGVALTALLLQPRAGYLGGDPLRTPKPVRTRAGRFPVAQLPAALQPPPPPSAPSPPYAAAPEPAAAAATAPQPWLADLISRAHGAQAQPRHDQPSRAQAQPHQDQPIRSQAHAGRARGARGSHR